MPFVLGLPHLCSLQTFVVAPCDAGGSFFTTTKWKPTSSCDMGGGHCIVLEQRFRGVRSTSG